MSENLEFVSLDCKDLSVFTIDAIKSTMQSAAEKHLAARFIFPDTHHTVRIALWNDPNCSYYYEPKTGKPADDARRDKFCRDFHYRDEILLGAVHEKREKVAPGTDASTSNVISRPKITKPFLQSIDIHPDLSGITIKYGSLDNVDTVVVTMPNIVTVQTHNTYTLSSLLVAAGIQLDTDNLYHTLKTRLSGKLVVNFQVTGIPGIFTSETTDTAILAKQVVDTLDAEIARNSTAVRTIESDEADNPDLTITRDEEFAMAIVKLNMPLVRSRRLCVPVNVAIIPADKTHWELFADKWGLVPATTTN